MIVTAIIAEFNPFHNGHKYLIEEARRITNADFCVAVISGNFVQRGEPALIDKYSRARMALLNGVDLIIELPVLSSTASAEGFAYGAVSLLNSLNCIDFLCFGCENADMTIMSAVSDFLINEPDEYKSKIKEFCSRGMAYPLARQMALDNYLNIGDTLKHPNTILGIEYIKSLKRLTSSITPIAVQRIGSSYHDNRLDNNYSSATAIRTALKNNSSVFGHIPDNCIDILNSCSANRGFIYEEDIFPIILPQLLNTTAEDLAFVAGANDFIANKIINNSFNFESYDVMLKLLSSKDYTLSRIKRVLIHLMLGIDKSYLPSQNFSEYTSHYARLLASDNEILLSHISKHSSIPIVHKLSNQHPSSEGLVKCGLDIDIKASNIYESLVCSKYQVKPNHEYSRNIFK